ncbi:MAG TPA: hypothetical protein VIG78_00095 [Gemmatimonadaceae bacterium]|jgi:hypothetical protein
MPNREGAVWAFSIVFALILVAVPALFWLELPSNYGFELSAEEANQWLPTIWLVALWLAVALAIRTDLRNRGIDGHVGYAVLQVLIGVFFVGLALFVRLLDWSGSDELQSVDRGDYRLVIREESCGATCDFDLALRQEWKIVPGLLRVRYLGYWGHASSGRITPLRTGSQIDSFEVHIAEWGKKRPVATDTVVVVAHSAWGRGTR